MLSVGDAAGAWAGRGPVPVAPPRRAAVLGSPVDHSLSPVLHEAAYAALGLSDWRYEKIIAGGPGEPTVAEVAAELGAEWIGLSLTMPNKEPGLAFADAVTARAELVGAVNTLVRIDGAWLGDSTDAQGLQRSLEGAGAARAANALVLGSGATARSVCAALAEYGATEVTFAVRGVVRAETQAVADALGLRTHTRPLSDLAHYAAEHSVVVSTLPTGTDLNLNAERGGAPGRGAVVVDVAYGGWPTPLARWAAAGGARVVPGTEMLLHQACEQVRLMTGRPAPMTAMRAALTAYTRAS